MTTLIGLVLIAVGTGGIKPCCFSLGGDQFQLPEQQDQLSKFLNGFIIAIYIGSSISMAITPELRKLPCLGKDTCFPLTFGVLSLLMLTAIGKWRIYISGGFSVQRISIKRLETRTIQYLTIVKGLFTYQKVEII